MPDTRRLKVCARRIEALRRALLPKVFDPLGNYSNGDTVQARTRGFILLAHAEVESYLEASARDVLRFAEARWKSTQYIAAPMGILLGLSDAPREPYYGRKGQPSDPSRQFQKHCERVVLAHYKAISDNNGVKERNVLRMFCPLGLGHSDVGSTLFPVLESFGSHRGVHAHDPIKGVTQVLDPEVEYKKIQVVLGELKSLDAWIRVRARKSVR